MKCIVSGLVNVEASNDTASCGFHWGATGSSGGHDAYINGTR